MCREKVAVVAGDAPFWVSKPFLQRMGAVLDLDATTDESTRENASSSGKTFSERILERLR